MVHLLANLQASGGRPCTFGSRASVTGDLVVNLENIYRRTAEAWIAPSQVELTGGLEVTDGGGFPYWFHPAVAAQASPLNDIIAPTFTLNAGGVLIAPPRARERNGNRMAQDSQQQLRSRTYGGHGDLACQR